MSENEPVDLRGLRPEQEDRDRVIAGAMQRIRAPAPAPFRAALEGSSRLLRPVLAAAAALLLFALLPGRSPHPDARAARVMLGAETDIPDSWLRWSFDDVEPDPREVLLIYAEPAP